MFLGFPNHSIVFAMLSRALRRLWSFLTGGSQTVGTICGGLVTDLHTAIPALVGTP